MTLFSQNAGSNDFSFNPADIGNGFGDGANKEISDIAIQSDGKIIIAGHFTSYDSKSAKHITRLNSDGSIDSLFNVGIGTNSNIYAIAIQQDGKILIAGDFQSYNGYASKNIARLHSDGSFDTTFQIGTSINNNNYSFIKSISIQSDGKIVIGGQFNWYNNISMNHLARLNSDGSLDNTFNIGSGCGSSVFMTEIQNDGKILISGYFFDYNGTAVNRFARLNSDGSLDLLFQSSPGVESGFVYDAKVQTDGKILIGGSFATYSGIASKNIARLNTDGSLDNSFIVGSGLNSDVFSVDILPNDQLLISGIFMEYNGFSIPGVALLNPDGTLDPAFNPGSSVNGSVYVTVVQEDNQILIGGSFNAYDNYPVKNIVRIQPNGTRDINFSNNSGANENILCSEVLTNGKIIIGGDFTKYNDTKQIRVCMLNSDGTIDPSFSSGDGPNNSIYSIKSQVDGKIVIGGSFITFHGISAPYITRLNQNGTIDTSFNIGLGFNAPVQVIEIQDNGKIVVGGDFTKYNGIFANHIIRLNADGSVDPTFDTGTGSNGTIKTIVLTPQSKIYLGGAFTQFNGTYEGHIVRLNEDGSIDNSFVTGNGFIGQIVDMKLQMNDKLVVAGSFLNYNNEPHNNLIRLNENGTVDETFISYIEFLTYIHTICVQSDSLIIIAGNFTTYQQTGRNNVARLNWDGSLDDQFDPGTGTNGSVFDCVIDENNKLIISGSFTNYNGVGRNRIARIEGEIVETPQTILIYPNPNNGQFTLKVNEQTVVEVYDVNGQMIHYEQLSSGIQSIDVRQHANGVYFVTITQSTGQFIQKFIKID